MTPAKITHTFQPLIMA